MYERKKTAKCRICLGEADVYHIHKEDHVEEHTLCKDHFDMLEDKGIKVLKEI